jgi:hypothetical protein
MNFKVVAQNQMFAANALPSPLPLPAGEEFKKPFSLREKGGDEGSAFAHAASS